MSRPESNRRAQEVLLQAKGIRKLDTSSMQSMVSVFTPKNRRVNQVYVWLAHPDNLEISEIWVGRDSHGGLIPELQEIVPHLQNIPENAEAGELSLLGSGRVSGHALIDKRLVFNSQVFEFDYEGFTREGLTETFTRQVSQIGEQAGVETIVKEL